MIKDEGTPKPKRTSKRSAKRKSAKRKPLVNSLENVALEGLQRNSHLFSLVEESQINLQLTQGNLLTTSIIENGRRFKYLPSTKDGYVQKCFADDHGIFNVDCEDVTEEYALAHPSR